jgi:hypothetical protein
MFVGFFINSLFEFTIFGYMFFPIQQINSVKYLIVRIILLDCRSLLKMEGIEFAQICN